MSGTGVGTVTVTATANDGSGIRGTLVVTVTTPEGCFTFVIETKTITDYIVACDGSDVVIPSTIGGIAVEHIGENAFKNKSLTSVIIPDSVKTIGKDAFKDNLLTSVTIGNSVWSIGESVFESNLLTSVTIPNSVTSIVKKAFKDNLLLISVTIIGNNLVTIGEKAFENDPLTSVTIGANVAIDGDSATMGTNTGFKTVYDGEGKLAGTYNYIASGWVKV